MRALPWIIASMLLATPLTAFGQGSEDFVFPSNDDERVGNPVPVIFRAGDGVNGQRVLEVDECDVISGTLVVAPNQLQDREECATGMDVVINNTAIGSIPVAPGARDIAFRFELDRAIGGPNYRVSLGLTADIAGGCGSIQLPSNQSSFTCEDIVREGENRRPVCDAGGPYTCDEGDLLTLEGQAQDPDGEDITIEWDFDDDGEFDDAEGETPDLDCELFDGPAGRTVFLRVSDGDLDRTCFAEVTVNNVAPDVVGEFAPPVLGAQNLVYAFCLEAEDASPLDDVVYELIEGPVGAELDEDGCILWVPTPEQLGDHEFQVRISDDDGGQTLRTWPVTVVENPNTPSAFAGEDQEIEPCSAEVCCQGSDPQGLPLEYLWSQLDGPAEVVIDEPEAECIQVALSDVGDYEFACAVNNGELTSPVDEVTVSVLNQSPTCDAGFNSTCVVDSRCTLDGRRSSDPNNDELFFRWQQTGPEEKPVRITGATNPITTFFPREPGIYCFEVTCRDFFDEGETDEVCVTVNQPEGSPGPNGEEPAPRDFLPVAHCGRDPQQVSVGDSVTLDGLRSYDPDGLPLVDFEWVQESGPEVVLDLEGAGSPLPTFTPNREGIYTFSLRVQDSPPHEEIYATERWSTPCTARVQAIAPDNRPPVASAGDGVVARQGAWAELDGSASKDADGDDLSFDWQQLRGPRVTLLDADTSNPRFSACTPGIYQFLLTVNDGRVDSLPSEVWTSIHSTCNEAPVAHAGETFFAMYADGIDATPEDRVILNARQSYDPDDNEIRYQWLQMDGLPTELKLGFTRRPYMEPTLWDIYRYRLFVLDSWPNPDEDPPDCWEPAWSLPSDVQIVISCEQNHIPVADAGGDKEWLIEDDVFIDGCGSNDGDGDELIYTWTQTCGPTLELGELGTCAPTFAADDVGEWCFCLTVDDGFAESLPDCVTYTVIPNNNEPPICRAGSEEYWVRAGEEFTLDGNGSFDPNADPLSFGWEQTCGEPVTLSAADQALASFRAPAVPEGENQTDVCFDLTVSDGRADAVSCGLTVHVQPRGNGGACDEPDPCDCPPAQRPLRCEQPGEGEGEGEGEGGTFCTPGGAQSCDCSDGSASNRICVDDGSEYGDCQCGDNGTDPSGGRGSESGCSSTSGDGVQSLGWLALSALGFGVVRRRR